jgi:hypothetical protein
MSGTPTFSALFTPTLLVGFSSVSEGVDPSTTSDPCFLAPEGAYPSTLSSLSPFSTR